MNHFLCKSVKRRDALLHERECNFCSLRMSGVEDKLCEFMASANNAKLAVQGDVGHSLVGDGTHDDL